MAGFDVSWWQVMLKKHESPTQMVERRKQAAYSAQLKFGENELRDLAAQQVRIRPCRLSTSCLIDGWSGGL